MDYLERKTVKLLPQCGKLVQDMIAEALCDEPDPRLIRQMLADLRMRLNEFETHYYSEADGDPALEDKSLERWEWQAHQFVPRELLHSPRCRARQGARARRHFGHDLLCSMSGVGRRADVNVAIEGFFGMLKRIENGDLIQREMTSPGDGTHAWIHKTSRCS